MLLVVCGPVLHSTWSTRLYDEVYAAWATGEQCAQTLNSTSILTFVVAWSAVRRHVVPPVGGGTAPGYPLPALLGLSGLDTGRAAAPTRWRSFGCSFIFLIYLFLYIIRETGHS